MKGRNIAALLPALYPLQQNNYTECGLKNLFFIGLVRPVRH
jgi:hypothetical protein